MSPAVHHTGVLVVAPPSNITPEPERLLVKLLGVGWWIGYPETLRTLLRVGAILHLLE